LAISYLPALRLAQQWPPSQQAEPDEQQESPPFLAALPTGFLGGVAHCVILPSILNEVKIRACEQSSNRKL
jgi:hypothetical protein